MQSQILLREHLIEETDKELQQITQDVSDIHTMFQDLSILVQEQGESLNSIENNIEHCVHHTDHANVSLEKARSYTKNNTKSLCVIVSCLSSIIIVMVFYFTKLTWRLLKECFQYPNQ